MKPAWNRALAVGTLAAVVGIAFLLALTFFRKGGFSDKDSYVVRAYFSDATGLTWKSRVQIAGIQVGEVSHIALEGARARLDIRVKNEVELHTDVCFTKSFPSALLPDALLEVQPGSLTAPLMRSLPEDKRIVTCVREATSVQQLLDSMSKIAQEVELVTGDLAKTVAGDRGLREIVENLASATKRIDEAIAANEQNVADLIENARDFAADLREISGRDKDKIGRIATNVEVLTRQLRGIAASLQDIIDPGASTTAAGAAGAPGAPGTAVAAVGAAGRGESGGGIAATSSAGPAAAGGGIAATSSAGTGAPGGGIAATSSATPGAAGGGLSATGGASPAATGEGIDATGGAVPGRTGEGVAATGGAAATPAEPGTGPRGGGATGAPSPGIAGALARASPEERARAQEQARGVRQAVDRLSSSLQKLDDVLGKVAEGKSVAGKLLVDERLGRKVGTAAEDVADYYDRIFKMQIQLQLRSEWLLNQTLQNNGRPGTKIYFGARLLPRPDKFYLVEVVSDPRGVDTTTTETVTAGTPPVTSITTRKVNEQKLTYSLQLGKRYGPVTFRIGIIEGSGGAGADLHLLHDKLELSASVYQFSRAFQGANLATSEVMLYPRAKVWLNYYFLNHFFMTSGVDDFFNRWQQGQYPGGRGFNIGTDVFFGVGLYFTDDDLKTLIGSGAGSAVSKG